MNTARLLSICLFFTLAGIIVAGDATARADTGGVPQIGVDVVEAGARLQRRIVRPLPPNPCRTSICKR